MEHSTTTASYYKAYYEQHKDRILARQRAWRAEQRARKQIAMLKNPPKQERKKAPVSQNPRSAYHRQYYLANRERLLEYQRKLYREKRARAASVTLEP